MSGTWILLRGWTRESAHWGAFPAELARALPGAQMVALDLPGTGHLHGQRSPARVAAIVAACRAQLAARGVVAPLRLVGLSLGGMVAASWAAEHPDEVAGCVFINTSMRPLAPWHRRLRPASWPAILRILGSHDPLQIERRVLALTSRAGDCPEVVVHWATIRRERPVDASNALRQLWAAARFRLPEPAPALPMLVLCGARDALVHPDCSRALAARWNCLFDEHPGAGHDLPLDDGPWVAERIAQWATTQRYTPAR
jgi:pimeloyl-ACP methyl ester carboxylesterase